MSLCQFIFHVLRAYICNFFTFFKYISSIIHAFNTFILIFEISSVTFSSEQRMCLGTFLRLRRSLATPTLYAAVRIPAERFCVIGTKFPITQKTPRGLNSLYQPARCLATCGFYFKYPVTLCAWRWCSSRNAQCSREFHDHLPGKSECRGSSWKKSGR